MGAASSISTNRSTSSSSGTVIVELKSVEKLLPIHEAQLLTYLRLSGKKVGLLMNFNVPVLKDGIVRRVL